MRHNVAGKRLGRPSNQRKALMKNLAIALITAALAALIIIVLVAGRGQEARVRHHRQRAEAYCQEWINRKELEREHHHRNPPPRDRSIGALVLRNHPPEAGEYHPSRQPRN